MTGGWMPFARIILRYGVGAMITYNIVSPELGDQLIGDADLVVLLAALLGVLVEGFYVVAKRRGWAT